VKVTRAGSGGWSLVCLWPEDFLVHEYRISAVNRCSSGNNNIQSALHSSLALFRDIMYTSSPSSSAGGGGEDDNHVNFHTPESGSVDGDPSTTTPMTTSTSTTSGKKRPASSQYPTADDDDDIYAAADDDNNSSVGGLLNWIGSAVKSITKRSRTSLDMTSVSAIKNANRTPSSISQGGAHGEALDDAEGNNSVDGSGTKLSKLNLNMKFDHTGGAAATAGHGAGGGGILRNAGRYQQQQHHRQQQQVVEEEWQPVANAIEGGDNTTNIGLWQQNKAAAASMPPPAKKTSFASSPYNAYAGLPDTADADTSTKMMSNTHTPPGLLFNMGSNNVNIDDERKMSPIRSPMRFRQPIKSLQGRQATPGARQQHMAGSTPGMTKRTMSGVGRGGFGNNTQFNSDTHSSSTSSSSSYYSSGVGRHGPMRRITGGTTAHQRRKQYKPMSRLLTQTYNPGISAHVSGGDGGGRIADSIVEQILAEKRRKMMDATFSVSSSNNSNTAERGLFGGGVVSTTPERQVARTFQEEEAMMMMANNRETTTISTVAADFGGGPVVTRVRMNRIYGTGQTGGVQPFPSSAMISTQNPTNYTMGTSSSMMFGSMNINPTTTAPPVTKKRAVTFGPQTTSSNVDISNTANESLTVPFNTKKLSPVITSYGFQFTPCKSEISMEEGRRIDELLHSAEFYRQAACDSQGYDEPIVTTPCKSGKKAKRDQTPHPRKAAIEMSTPALLNKADSVANAMNSHESGDSGVKSVGGGGGGGINAKPGGAPFHFMSGGAAASSFVSTPLAYKFANAKSAIATPTVKSAPTSSVSQSAIGAPTTAVTAVAPPAQTMGFGNMFALKPGEWKCNICTTKNPKEAAQKCLSCEAAKPGANSLVDNMNTGTKSSTKPSVGTIGTGGFSFGGPPSSTLTRPSTHSKSSVSFGVGATPAKAKLDLNDENKKQTPASIGAGGFSFGTAASTTPAISSLGNGNASSASGGFSFGGPTSTSANTPAKPKASGESTIKSSIGFKFGTLTEEKKVESVSINTSNGFSFGASDKGGFSFAMPPPVANAADKRDEGNVSEPVSKKRTTFAFGTTGGSESSPLVSRDTISVPPSTPGLSSSNSSGFALGAPQQASVSATPVPHFTFGAAPTPATEAETKNVAHASTSKSLFNFGVATPAPASKPDGASAITPAAPFAFGSSTSQTPSISGGAAFSFGAGATPSSFTPAPTAPPANPQPSTTPGFAFAAGSTPSAFGSMPGGFGNSSQPAVATPAPTAMAAPFPFGAGVTPAAPSTGGFGGAATSFGFNSTPAPINTPVTFGFGGAPVATPNPGQGFAAGAPSFNSTPSFMGSAATPSTNGGGAGAFSIGTGGSKKTPGRRIVKAKRPTPGGGR